MKRLAKLGALLFGIVLIATVVALAVTPHRGCACAGDLNAPQKPPQSMLTHIVKRLVG